MVIRFWRSDMLSALVRPIRSDVATKKTHKKTPRALLTIFWIRPWYWAFLFRSTAKRGWLPSVSLTYKAISWRVRSSSFSIRRGDWPNASLKSNHGRLEAHILIIGESERTWRALIRSLHSPSYSSSPSMKKQNLVECSVCFLSSEKDFKSSSVVQGSILSSKPSIVVHLVRIYGIMTGHCRSISKSRIVKRPLGTSAFGFPHSKRRNSLWSVY